MPNKDEKSRFLYFQFDLFSLAHNISGGKYCGEIFSVATVNQMSGPWSLQRT